LLSEYCYRWQCDYNGYCLDANHISNIWLKDLMANSWIQS
jgi:hypothetical protein